MVMDMVILVPDQEIHLCSCLRGHDSDHCQPHRHQHQHDLHLHHHNQPWSEAGAISTGATNFISRPTRVLLADNSDLRNFAKFMRFSLLE